MTTQPQHAITLEGLTRRFAVRQKDSSDRRGVRGELTAVDGVTLRIPRGELFGLLGPNGAGKTTTIRMLCTLLPPTGGSGSVWDFDVVRQPAQVRRHIGVLLTGERSVYWRLTGRENLAYFAALYEMPPAGVQSRIAGLLELVDLTGRADDLVERYSLGMRQRLALIKTLLHDPPVLLLDEPTAGLDPQASRIIRDLIRHLHREEGKTILLTTHSMEEADQLCERVGIMDQGRIVALDSPLALKRAHQGDMILRMEVDGHADHAAPVLRAIPGVVSLALEPLPTDSSWEITMAVTDITGVLPQAMQAVNAQGGHVRHLQLVETSLEDVFIALTGRRLRD
ncbi:MAG TPA: ABC transporter ATP-binding protein [bacterium]|nr:ABC transporter ATP-binding protein [bacterium]